MQYTAITNIVIFVIENKHQAKLKKLYEIADSQNGYFSGKQAAETGFAYNHHGYYLKNGEWEREYRGVYRLIRYPLDNDDQLALWSIWSRDKNQNPQGVYSHETALSIYELSDVSPSKLHMTVPPNFRRQAPIPGVLVLHKGVIDHKDIEQIGCYSVTTPMKTILDLGEEGITSRDFIEQAIDEGVKKGYLAIDEIKEVVINKALQPWLKELFERHI